VPRGGRVGVLIRAVCMDMHGPVENLALPVLGGRLPTVFQGADERFL
jgi:hypothetical protein